MLDGIETQVADRRARLVAVAPDEGPDAGKQLVHLERLAQVVVSARVETGELVGQGAAGREEEHRCVDVARPDRSADVTAVSVGQADIDD